MQPTPTTQSTHNPTDEMKKLLAIVKQQSTYSDIATHIQQIELLASAIRAQLAALRTKQSGELNKSYTTTAVAQRKPKPKRKATVKPKLPSKPRLPPTPPIPSNKQLQPQTTPPQTTYQPNPIGTNEKPSTQGFGATNNFLPIRPTPYDKTYK